MANITVGTEVKVTGLGVVAMLIGQSVTGQPANMYGVVKHVNPTAQEIGQYAEINPQADGEGKAIYFDVLANRHFIMPLTELALDDEGALV